MTSNQLEVIDTFTRLLYEKKQELYIAFQSKYGKHPYDDLVLMKSVLTELVTVYENSKSYNLTNAEIAECTEAIYNKIMGIV